MSFCRRRAFHRHCHHHRVGVGVGVGVGVYCRHSIDARRVDPPLRSHCGPSYVAQVA